MFRQGFAQRRVSMVGDDGGPHHFLVQFCRPAATRTDERMCQLVMATNKLLQGGVQSRSRRLVMELPVVVALTPRMRLFEDHGCYVSFADVLDSARKYHGSSVDQLAFNFRLLCSEMEGTPDVQLAAYRRVCAEVVPDNILSAYMSKTLPSPDSLAVFRYRLAHHVAMVGFMSYMLNIGDRTPQRVRAHPVPPHCVAGRVARGGFVSGPAF